MSTKKLSCPQITDADIERDTEMGTLVVNYDKFAKETDEWTEAYDRCKQKILDGQKAIETLGKIEIYVRLLQDGDPENEKPNEILDYIEKEVEPMLKVIYNE